MKAHLSYKQVQDALDSIDSAVFDQLANAIDFQSIPSESAMKLRMRMSEIKECKEIEEKLVQLTHYINMLRAAILKKDADAQNKALEQLESGTFASIGTVEKEIQQFQQKIANVETLAKQLDISDTFQTHIGSLRSICSQEITIISSLKAMLKTLKAAD